VVKSLSKRWWIPTGARLEGPKLEPEGPRAEVGFPTADQGFSRSQKGGGTEIRWDPPQFNPW